MWIGDWLGTVRYITPGQQWRVPSEPPKHRLLGLSGLSGLSGLYTSRSGLGGATDLLGLSGLLGLLGLLPHVGEWVSGPIAVAWLLRGRHPASRLKTAGIHLSHIN